MSCEDAMVPWKKFWCYMYVKIYGAMERKGVGL